MNINDFKRKIQEKQAEITKAIHRTLPIKIGRKAADHFQDNFRKGGFAVGHPPHPGLAGNPAKTRAIFSQDHPYFPKDCNHCAFYKPNIKSRLRSLFKAKAKDCYNCPFINGCIDRATKTRKEKKGSSDISSDATVM